MVLLSTVEGSFADMKCRATFDEYLGDPIGIYTMGPMYLHWSSTYVRIPRCQVALHLP